jgi:hypothetical protein
MDTAPAANPLRVIGAVTGALLAIDVLQLYTHHGISFIGYTRMALLTVFLLLYLTKSRFAWHVAVAIGPVILVVYLFLYFTGGHIYRPPRHAREVMIIWAIGEVIVLAVFLTYLFRLRQPYFSYVSRPREHPS